MNTILYYSLFSFSLLTCFSIAKLYKDTEAFCKFFVWLTMTLFAGLRVAVGRDYMIYLDTYTSDLSVHFSYLEPFWQVFNIVANNLGVPFHLWQTFFAGLCYFILLKALKSWRVDWVLGILCYILIYKGYFESLNQVRQCLAMVIVLWALSFLYHKAYRQFVVLCLVTSIFHVSAIVCLLMLPIINLRWRRGLLITFLVGSLLLGIFFFKEFIRFFSFLVPSNYIAYIDKLDEWKTGVGSSLFRIVLNVIALLFTYLIYKNKKFQDSPYDFFIRMFVFSICIYNVFFSLEPAMRLMNYPFICLILLLPLSLQDKSSYCLKTLGFCSLLSLTLFTLKDVSNGRESYAHYDIILNKSYPIPVHDERIKKDANSRSMENARSKEESTKTTTHEVD